VVRVLELGSGPHPSAETKESASCFLVVSRLTRWILWPCQCHSVCLLVTALIARSGSRRPSPRVAENSASGDTASAWSISLKISIVRVNCKYQRLQGYFSYLLLQGTVFPPSCIWGCSKHSLPERSLKVQCTVSIPTLDCCWCLKFQCTGSILTLDCC
jgi:hypothetical protein